MRLLRLFPFALITWFPVACADSASTPDTSRGGNPSAAGGIAGVAGVAGSRATSSAGDSVGGVAHGGAGGATASGATGGAALAGSATTAGESTGGTVAILPPLGPAPVDKPETVEVGVRNNCPFPVWIHASGKQGTLMPDYEPLQKGDAVWYDAPKQWDAARITAYGDETHQNELDKVEMTFDAAGDVLNYNITYVDWVTLPMEMIARGRGDCKKVGCYVPEANVLAGCPDGLLDGKRCQAARTYCLGGKNDDRPYCHALDPVVELCAAERTGCEGATGNHTANAYACDKFFASSPKWCAAVNRGMLDDPESKDTSAYYQKPPYNTYSKWVHALCPGIYAFAYDDYPPSAEESGFHACNGGKDLEITFCPAG